MSKKYDFSGWVTRYGTLCSDGRTIVQDAFKHCDGKKVPLVWNHQHGDVSNVMGSVMLENRQGGVYGYGSFNSTNAGEDGRGVVAHGDIVAMSIYANHLTQKGRDPISVMHGDIREVSLVLAGANPGAFIDDVAIQHEDGAEFEADIYHGMSTEDGDEEAFIVHADEKEDKPVAEETKKAPEAETKEKTIQDVIESMTDEQRNVMYAMVGQALQHTDDNNETDEEDDSMRHNVFETENRDDTVLTHADQVEILKLAKSDGCGSLQAAMKIYAEEHDLQHTDIDISGFAQTGNGNITTMFPEFVEAHPSRTPELITNDLSWVDAVMAKTQKVPHGRVRTSHIDIRNIDALKAKGYKKGDKKNITGNYSLVRRTTDPQTVYVTSELHRDDMIDIEDFDYVDFQYKIDQMSLKETLGVATMIGDDRPESDPEKIFPEHIRPVWTDDELYTIHRDIDYDAMAQELQGADAKQYFGKNFIWAEATVNALRMARKDFRGTGKPDFYTTTDMLNTMLLARDRDGRRIYTTVTELAQALGVGQIYEVVQFEDRIRTDSDQGKHKLLGIVVNMADYAYGASKGGDVTHFNDFDIKFNKLQSLLETRKSGQLTRIKSAIVLEQKVTD